MKSSDLVDIHHVQTISGQTQNYALIGHPLGHTWSPQIHNAFFSFYGMEAAYFAFPVASAHLEEAFPALMGAFEGINVTIPHKRSVLPLLDDISEEAQILGAVNTIRFKEGRAEGYNTDAKGFQYALLSAGIRPEGMQVAVLGGGGTARTVTYILRQMHARVVIYTRSPEKAEPLRALGAWDVRPLSRFAGGFDMLVNTTPVGMAPHVRSIPVSVEGIQSCGIVYDAIYNPLRTMMLSQALGPALNGLSMLVYQAAHAQELWHGKLASKEVIAAIIQQLQQEKTEAPSQRK